MFDGAIIVTQDTHQDTGAAGGVHRYLDFRQKRLDEQGVGDDADVGTQANIPNARMDRVKKADEVFTLKWFADFINALHFCRNLARAPIPVLDAEDILGGHKLGVPFGGAFVRVAKQEILQYQSW